MATNFDQIEKDALEALAAATDSAAIEKWRIAWLGRSAPVMGALGTLGTLPKEERKAFGQRGNQVKQTLERAFEEASERIRQVALASALEAGAIDVTAPGRRRGPMPTGRTSGQGFLPKSPQGLTGQCMVSR